MSKPERSATAVIGALVLGLCWHATAQKPLTWIQDSFEDFAAGKLDAAGQDLFVSRDGKVRTIQRFDLNQDGFIDLVFNSTHDYTNFVPATMVAVGSGRRIAQSEIDAVEGSTRVVVEDLNRDGFPDAIFCPNDSGIQDPRRFLTILWGSADGYSSRRSTAQLPVSGATSVAIADLNHDGWSDIVVLNQKAWLPGQPEGQIIRVFWGAADGYLLTRYRDLGVPDALELASADFDGDGAKDLAVLTGRNSVRIYSSRSQLQFTEIRLAGENPVTGGSGSRRFPTGWPRGLDNAIALAAGDVTGDRIPDLVIGTATSRTLLVASRPGGGWDTPVSFEGFPASQISIGDLDGDGHPDLVLTEFATARALGGEVTGAAAGSDAPVHVLWGAAGGFSSSRSLKFQVPYASSTAIGDLDGDGKADIGVSVFQGQKTLANDSVVYFGMGDRRFANGAKVHTKGATAAAFVPGSGSGSPRLMFANSLDGAIGELVNSTVYWGGPKGFDPARTWDFPMRSGYESSAADLNGDGYVDLIAVNSGHSQASFDSDPTQGANIFWGGPKGFDPEHRRTVIHEIGVASSAVADLDKDGYLDLVLGAFESPGKPTVLVVRYGSAKGFDASRRVALASDGGSTSVSVADFNEDGWLDIACISSAKKNTVRIFWGSAQGFDAGRQKTLTIPYAIALETADLNKDGHLDLLVGSYSDEIAGVHDTGLSIFWGSKQGFDPSNAQWLPGFAPEGMAVADFDGDGWLDVFCPHYLGNGTRESLPSYLYWGGPDGFHNRRRTILVTDSAHDALAADFDRDGKIDLAVVCHTRDGSHHSSSKVFYNDGNRFENPRVVTLPTVGPHWMWDQDMGHIADRRWSQTYESSVWEFGRRVRSGQLSFQAQTQPGARLTVEVRSAATRQDLSQAKWQTVSSASFSLDASARCLQYRAIFLSDNGDRYPVLDRVEVTLTE